MAGIFTREHAKAVQIYDNVLVMHPQKGNADTKIPWQLIKEQDPGLSEGIPTYHIVHKPSPIPRTHFLIYYASILSAFHGLYKNGYHPDIIHAHVFEAGLAAVILGKLYHLPVVITEHSSAFPRRTIRKFDLIRARYALGRAKMVMPVSLALQKGIENYGIKANYRIIANVVNIELFTYMYAYAKDPELKRILFAGNLNPVKGIEYLLQALSGLNKQHTNWRLDILGDGPESPRYKALCDQFGLSQQVTFHGLKTKREVAEFMSESNLFVLPSLYETQGCVLIEAMASGLPIVSTNAGLFRKRSFQKPDY